jgi:hypothetical protein
VAYYGGADSMFQFWLDRGCDVMKHCQKMKQKQQTRLDLMGRKHDMVRQRDNVVWMRGHWRGEREETMSVGLPRILLG